MTANKAAAEVRHKIKRKMKDLDERAPSKDDHSVDYAWCWAQLRRYIDGMAKRASSKKGGLGRK